ncbi:MAG: mandelate racemase/muconate lactonizing enzyme family protein [Nocardiopsaceae bacterium]|jgi:L-alanine-DL-glutamate epimerase-like enolase superfamily enzyme|nr:mandelate racemase/muconate lactonizing enzyme family protein [Nocardiopsaceae bacterium]
MKITGIELIRLELPLRPPFTAAWDPQPRRNFLATLVLVDTDEGVRGVGSGDSMAGFDGYLDLFLGTDPLALARQVRVLETVAFHGCRPWPLEAALWDIAGQVAGQPVARLLGGFTDRMLAYASTGALAGRRERVEMAQAAAAAGFRALKIRVDPAQCAGGLGTVAAVRAALPGLKIMVDLNQGWRMPGDTRAPIDPVAARRILDQLAELDVFWLEEPLAATDVRGLAALRAAGRMRIAGGEMVRSYDELTALAEADALDVYQPDAVLAAGISRARTLAEHVLAKGRMFSPHTWTNGIGLLANLHLTAGVGGGPYLEYPYDPPGWTPQRRDFMLAEPVTVTGDGYLVLSERPGLGIVLDDDAVRRYRV